MSQYDNEKKIALFKNDKGDNPKRPDYRGTLTLNGVEYKVSMWERQDKQGRDYLNGSIEVKTEGAPQSARPSQFRPPESDSGTVKTFMKPQAGGASGVNAPASLDEDVPFAPFKF